MSRRRRRPFNRPRQAALRYRVGTHATFLADMGDRLAGTDLGLTTRDPSDPAIALLDAWATAADVLTFYQERIANEGFLGTATERRSLVGLAALVGYQPRPGVAAGVDLAFFMQEGAAGTIPPGTQAQSVPTTSGELPQTFETAEALTARSAWNTLRPRRNRRPDLGADTTRLFLRGTDTRLEKNDPLIVVGGTPSHGDQGAADTPAPTAVRRVVACTPDHTASRTEVELGAWPAVSPVFSSQSPPVAICVLRRRAAVFGATAPLRQRFTQEMMGDDPPKPTGRLDPSPKEWKLDTTVHAHHLITLDTQCGEIMPGDVVLIDREPAGGSSILARVERVSTAPRTAYGLSAKATQLTLDPASLPDVSGRKTWLPEATGQGRWLSDIRQVTVHVQPDPLRPARQPIDAPFEKGTLAIDLDGRCDGLEVGRRLIVASGPMQPHGAPAGDDGGPVVTEVVTIAGIARTDSGVADDGAVVTLEKGLANAYDREPMTIYGNVVRATHGERRAEVLGSGENSTIGQAFPLSFTPLTFLPTRHGAHSTLEVRVNGVRWHESAHPAALEPAARSFLVRIDDHDTATVVFGDHGGRGGRPPTGAENITAEYRQGLGAAGNLGPGRISVTTARPLGVDAVTNPLAASGGADRDGPETIRRNAPLAVRALGRLVSVRDYEDFAHHFPGIGKACARRLWDGHRQVVHLTIAGVDDAAIGAGLATALERALRGAGDPDLVFAIAERELVPLQITARVRVLPDHRWEDVKPRIVDALLITLGFERRALGQPVFLGQVIATIQAQAGVSYADVEVLDRVGGDARPLETLGVDLACAVVDGVGFKPAQLAYLQPEKENGRLTLEEITP